VSGSPRRAQTRQAALWLALREIGPATLAQIAEHMNLRPKICSGRLRDLCASGRVLSTGPHMRKTYQALGDAVPSDGRGGLQRRERVTRAQRLNSTCKGMQYVLQCRREGTSEEIPSVPRLIDLLMPR
jgi:hypothetical protein